MNMQRKTLLGNSQSLKYSSIYLLRKKQNESNPQIKKNMQPPPQQNKTQEIKKTNKNQKEKHKHENNISFQHSIQKKKWNKHGKLCGSLDEILPFLSEKINDDFAGNNQG